MPAVFFEDHSNGLFAFWSYKWDRCVQVQRWWCTHVSCKFYAGRLGDSVGYSWLLLLKFHEASSKATGCHYSSTSSTPGRRPNFSRIVCARWPILAVKSSLASHGQCCLSLLMTTGCLFLCGRVAILYHSNYHSMHFYAILRSKVHALWHVFRTSSQDKRSVNSKTHGWLSESKLRVWLYNVPEARLSHSSIGFPNVGGQSTCCCGCHRSFSGDDAPVDEAGFVWWSSCVPSSSWRVTLWLASTLHNFTSSFLE